MGHDLGKSANAIMGSLLGLPPFPVATHSRPKLPALLAYAGERPFIWLDDDVPPMDSLRIELRAERIPTRLIRIDPDIGLTTTNISAVEMFIASVNEIDDADGQRV